ncbi:MAG: hypothetical protein KKH72_10635 [Alphaproteobacteria bacterium]|nr:hypothetical protein [Alphaproteobacteria bacterium]
MTNIEAKRRYFRVFIPAMVIFLGASGVFAALGLDAQGPSPAILAFAILPVGSQIALFVAHLRFIGEVDEYLRSIQIKAVLFALAVILIIATGWGYLEAYASVPRLHILWLNPIYWVSYAVAAMTLSLRATGQAE